MSRGKRKTTVITESVITVNLNNVVTVIKTAQCPSSSGRSELTYQLGIDEEQGLYIKIHGNSGNGYYNEEWTAIQRIRDKLSGFIGHFPSYSLQALFQGKSINTPYFLAAALLAEGFLIKDPDNSRYLLLGDVEGFMVRTRSLVTDQPMTIKETSTPKPKRPTLSNQRHDEPEPQQALLIPMD